jgi:hypothetical protein
MVPQPLSKPQVADIKEKNYEEEEGAGAGAAWLGLVSFLSFFLLTLTLHRVSSDVA